MVCRIKKRGPERIKLLKMQEASDIWLRKRQDLKEERKTKKKKI